jgi:hypothetical protein
VSYPRGGAAARRSGNAIRVARLPIRSAWGHGAIISRVGSRLTVAADISEAARALGDDVAIWALPLPIKLRARP